MHILEAIVFGVPTLCGRCGKSVDFVYDNCGWCRECKNRYNRERRRKKDAGIGREDASCR